MIDEEFERIFKRIREVEKRIREYMEDEIRKTMRSIREELAFAEGLFRPMWNHEGHLRPLYSINDRGSYYEILIDLPKADEKTIDVRFQGNLMFLRAKLKEEITFSGISGKGGETKFYEYREVIELPIVVDPNNVRIDIRKGIIRVLIYK